MSNSLDSFLTRIGDVTIERVTPRGSPRTTDQSGAPSGTLSDGNTNDAEPQTANDESSEDSSGEMSEGEQEKKMESPRIDEIEEIHSEGSGDDMDLDETIDTQIGVRMESERQQSHSSSSQDDDIEAVNILDTLPLEGAPIEGQEVSEADLLGKPVSKEIEDAESIDNENEKVESQSEEEEDGDGSKRHADSDSQDSTKKKQKKEDGNEGSSTECELKAEKKIANMRRNIREVMDETQLDEATLAAQRQEMERLRRVQEQQKIIREVQRQIAINRQNNKTQTRVISLLQGKQNQAGTTISSASPSSSQVRLPSTVLLKVNSGSGSSQSSSTMQTSQMQRRSIDAMRWQKGRGAYQGAQTSISRVPNRSTGPNMLQQRIRMMTPSVSISPVIPKKEPIDRSEYYSDSEISDIEADEALREKQLHTMRKMSSTQKVQKPMKGKDVVTISSSSESSDDDCIVLSDPSGGEETDTEDDPSNSGMHTNDRYNVPDEHGRVLINVGHPDTEPDVFLAPQVARIIKPHQIGGIRFLYDNIVESIERFKTSSGFGCILAHSMGLGKTLQVASFCDIFFRCTSAKTVLCIMPINTLQNWLAEFNMWLPYEDASSSKQDSGMNIKLDSSVESKQEIKEECGSQSDISNVSRPISTESVHRIGQDNISQPSNTENPFPHQGYETHSMVPNYMQESMLNKNGTDPNVHISQSYPSDISQSSMYSSNANSVSNFDPMKPEMDCHNISTGISATNCRLDNSGSGSVYSRIESQSQGPMYANMENRISSAPGSLYPGLDSQTSAPVYPGYENPSFTHTFSSYDPTQKLEQGIKQEPDQGTEINIKKEPEEAIKKEEGSCITPKEEMVEEKKEVEKVKTPFNVDTPIGMEVRPRHFRLHILNDSHKTMTARARVIHDWQKGGGVLLIGYELYRQLSLKKPNKAKRKRGQPFKDMVDVEEEDKNKGLLDEMHGALVNPGPDLVICDEGHRIKNSHASISLALKQMRTKRRIVLTGYPLQNNLLEYWCMVDFVRPNYLGTKSEFCNMFERPIQNGQCIDSTPQDIRLMRYRAHVLHALLEGFVQRRSHSVLQVSLPRKEEYILLVRMTAHQRKLYDTFMNQVVKTRAVPNPLKAFAVCCKIWNHPDILYHFLRKRQANEEDDLDLEETIGDKPTPGTKRSKARQPKGEPKKGKKTNNTTIKNKPAASVQPNSSSSSSNDNVESDNSKAGNYPNYTLPVTNSGYSNSVAQGSYPQGYQAYRSGDQNNFYRSEGTQGEYEFYNSQGQQQRYGNQSFQPYSQTPGYNPTQSYPSQPHNYLPSNNDQSAGHAQRYPPGPSSNDFRPDQTQGNNYDPTGIYPRQPYSYQDQGRSYTSSMNQGTNYSQVANQSQTYQNQLPNQPSNLPISDYPSYTTSAAQPQNYTPTGGQSNQIYPRTENQPGQNMPSAQNSTLAYSSNRQSQTPTPQTQPVGYLATQQSQNPPSQNQTRGFSPNQQNQQSQSLQNSTHAYSSTQQGQNVTLQQQNQSHGYASNQVQGQNPTSQTSALGYAPNQQTSNSVTQNPNRGYAPNQSGQASVVAHNQIRGYPSTPQSQNIAPQSQTTNIYSSHQQTSSSTSQNQTSHGYPVDQQGPISNSQNPIHGYPANHLVQTPTPQNQTPAFSPNPQSQTPAPLSQAHGYLTNQQGQTTVSQNTSHRYPANQQGQNSMSQSQTHGYSSIQPSQNSSLSQNSQIYSRSDNQTTQNYSATSNASRDYPVDRQGGNSVATPAANYTQSQQDQTQNPVLPTYPTETNHPNQVGQFKGPEDPYWQRNYSQSFRQDQCNDPYYRDSSVNRYQNNYFPSQNYSNQSYEYSTNHSSEVNSRSDESKIQSGTTSTHVSNQGTSVKSSKDTTATSTGAQNQSMSQDGLSTSTGYNNETELNRQNSVIPIPKPSQNTGTCHGNNSKLGQSDLMKEEEREKEDELDKDNKDKEDKSDDEILNKDEEKDSKYSPGVKEDPGIPYDWATELMKSYVPGLIDASAKMTLFFCILEEAVRIGDRVLAFSQSLFTLNLIEDFLARNSLKFPDGQTDAWVKNVNYYRLDGSTSALEREKLINEFNANPKIHLFLVSTRAGSLGINLVGANRAIVFDASWNPCHDTQAVCRVYRYGQQKPCFVYRLVTDNCLERKIYDRQISKQGMADRVVDQCNPDAHLSLKEATTLSWDWEEDGQVQDFSQSKDSYTDEVMHCVLERHSSLLTKQPFHHESLLVDRKDKKLSQAEKRLARRGYELEKMAANCSRPSYSYVPGNTATRAGGLQIRAIRGGDTGATSKPVASVRPMQQRGVEGLGNARGVGGSRWIPAEVWQRQGMSAQEMTLPLDVVIPTNSPDKGSIVLKAGQRVMVLKSPKGIYMQLESGKIIAIRTALKLNQQKREEEPKKGLSLMTQRNAKPEVSFPLRNNSAISIIPKSSSSTQGSGRPFSRPGGGLGYRPFADKEMAKRPKPVATAAAKPYLSQVNLTNQVSLSRLPRVKQEPVDHSSIGENSNSSDSQVRTEQRVEEVRLEDVVAEVSSNTDYGSSNLNRPSNVDSDSTLQKPSEDRTQVFSSDGIIGAENVQTRHDCQSESSEITPIAEKEHSQSENNETTKTDSLLDYDRSFENQKEKVDTSNDDIIIEEPLPPPVQQVQDVTKNLRDSSNSSAVSVSAGTNTRTTSPKGTESSVRESPEGDPHSVPQGYPYAQYPRYYDYVDPRSRSLSSPYGTYFPSIPLHSTSATSLPVDAAKPQSDVGKSTDRGTTTNTSGIYPNQTPGSTRGSVKTPENKTEPKSIETTTTMTTTTMTARDDTHVPTAFSHPTNTRYPGPYPSGPYDPYSQHYPPAPGSSAAYPPGGAPGYPAYGGPTYNSEYARMYSAFHGPPPAADPYMHRAYAPPTSHPPNYYPPFPHPPPPYPNYTFLPPYPNPNMPSEPQPPAQ